MGRSGSIRRYVLQRFLQAVPLLLGVIVVNFLLLHLAPGDPVTALLGDFPAPPEYIAELRVKFGLDLPLWQQLWIYLTHALQGDLGFSFAQREQVVKVIASRVMATLLLTGSALMLSTVVGIILGVIAARRPYSLLDNFISTLGLVGYSMPVFWLGQLLILAFALTLGVLPAQGMRDLRALGGGPWEVTVDVAKHLILPSFALSLRYVAVVTRMTRASLLEVMNKEFIVTAYAKGLHERIVRVRHGLRNALLPVVTVIGFHAGFLLSGSALIETVFAWPGIGRLLYDSVRLRDYPVLMGIFLLVSVTVLLANLITDILYAYLDPRIRF